MENPISFTVTDTDEGRIYHGCCLTIRCPVLGEFIVVAPANGVLFNVVRKLFPKFVINPAGVQEVRLNVRDPE